MTALLKLAIAESGANYTPECSNIKMGQNRSASEIAANSGKIDIMWAMTTPEREAQLRAIRVPLYRGLIGWRVLLIRADQRDEFAKIRGKLELAKMTSGQLADWPDTPILRSNGLAVTTTHDFEGLFHMLTAKRFDYFPRAVIEAADELAAHPGLGLTIEPHLLIHYPSAFYFFVSRDREELAQALEKGLMAAEQDGRFRELFDQFFGEKLKALDLPHRQVIELTNPLLPIDTPLDNKALWYEVGK